MKKLKPDQRFKRIERILKNTITESLTPEEQYGIFDIDTMSAWQAYSLIDTNFGNFILTSTDN